MVQETPEEFKGLTSMAEILDNRFRIPGTNIRFGIDGIIGLFPYIGDVVTFQPVFVRHYYILQKLSLAFH
ncbi:MAG: DUF4112 domain-containing protein, partial [Bacteroidota bacterium]